MWQPKPIKSYYNQETENGLMDKEDNYMISKGRTVETSLLYETELLVAIATPYGTFVSFVFQP